MSAVFASQMQSVFAALVYILPIISAVISDQWAGRWIMAITSYAGYVPGGLVLTLGCYYKIDWLCLLSYYLLFAIPASFIKPNLVTLGADQFDARDTDQLRQRGNFFGAQYWMTNVAAAIAFLVMSDLAVSGLGAISKDFGFTFTFIVGTVCLAVGSYFKRFRIYLYLHRWYRLFGCWELFQKISDLPLPSSSEPSVWLLGAISKDFGFTFTFIV